MKHRVFMLFLALCLPMAAFASGTATVQANNEKSTLYWQDGMVRVSTSGQSGYMIVRDGHLYVVSTNGGNTRVMDMTGVAQGLARIAGSSSGKAIPGVTTTIDSVTPTGNTQTVAGITGHVYKVKTTSTDGSTQVREAVLTDNPLVTEMTAAYIHAVAMLVGQNKVQHMRAKLPDDNRGLLKSGSDFTLLSISDSNPDDSLFTLPAKPTSLSDVMNKALKMLKQSGMSQ